MNKIPQKYIDKIREIANFLTEDELPVIENTYRKLLIVRSGKIFKRMDFLYKEVVEKNFKKGNPPILTTEDFLTMGDDEISGMTWNDVYILLVTAVTEELHKKNIKIYVSDLDVIESGQDIEEVENEYIDL